MELFHKVNNLNSLGVSSLTFRNYAKPIISIQLAICKLRGPLSPTLLELATEMRKAFELHSSVATVVPNLKDKRFYVCNNILSLTLSRYAKQKMLLCLKDLSYSLGIVLFSTGLLHHS